MEVPRLVALSIFTSGRRVLLERRPDSGPLPGQWQFPGGKVEFGEHPWDALRREMKEEIGLSISRGAFYGVYSHVYDIGGERIHYVLIAYRIPVDQTRVEVREDRRWVAMDELKELPIVPGSRPIVDDLLDEARRQVT